MPWCLAWVSRGDNPGQATYILGWKLKTDLKPWYSGIQKNRNRVPLWNDDAPSTTENGDGNRTQDGALMTPESAFISNHELIGLPVEMTELAIGQTVELSDGRFATVRFVGQPHFAPGDWVGVELEDNSGKNDGSVQGERYFDCEMGRGMFIRPAAVTIIAQPPPPAPSNGVPKRTGRPSSLAAGVGRRLNLVSDPSLGKRQAMNAASPSPAARRPTSLRSPTKSPTKQLASTGTSTASSPRGGTPRTGTPSNPRQPSHSFTKPRTSASVTRTSMGPPLIPASRAVRQATAETASPTTRLVASPGRPLSGRSLLVPSSATQLKTQGLGSNGSQQSSSQVSEGSGNNTPEDEPVVSRVLRSPLEILSPKATSPVLSRTLAIERNEPPPAKPTRGPASAAVQRDVAVSTATNREVEDLKAKLRLMERKRMEDRDKLKAMEKIQAERDKFESIVQKLQIKYQPQQQEITDLRKQLKESATKFEEIENMQAEHDVVLEMATLDREMAEETAEVLRTEMEALKLKAEELELEVEVLREENAELGGEMSPEDKASKGWLQMERNNDRLREALIRLRDMTQQQESDLRNQVKSLEDDLSELSGVKDHYEAAKQKLAQSEASIEDLRQQLDNALGAEDMIEELTEKNMSMSEQIEELKATIEDLESLKELNDELEVNHVETEKELQEDINFKDGIINDQARRAAQQDATLGDMEYTLSRFRELVTNLQTDLEDMKASHAVTETESEQLSGRSRAIMDLNMKLQASAAKTQVKTIDLELRRLDAQEASDHLGIVQLFLPEAFHSDRDSVLALLRFKRIGFKANLLHGFIKERVNGKVTPGHEDDVFAACDVLDKLSWVSAMCDRFVNAISHCSIEQFGKYEGAMYELEPVERALNGWIDGLRRDDLREKQCASELQRTIALMSHLAEAHISDDLESYADEVHMRALVMQSHLENAAGALTAAKGMVQHAISSHGDEFEMLEHFSRKTDAIITQTRSAKVVVGKSVRSLENLRSRSLSLLPDTIQFFEQCESGTQELALFTRRLGDDLSVLLNEEGRNERFTYREIQSTIYRSASAVFETSESDILSTFSNKLRILSASLTELFSLSSDLEMTQEFERAQAPWVLRSQELKSARSVPIDTEEEMRRLKDDNQERARLIAMRDKTLEEKSVKIELLESRMRDATKKNQRIAELEKRIEEAKKRETELSECLDSQNKEMTGLESDRDKWRQIAEQAKALGDISPGSKAGKERAVATAREMDALKAEIASLQVAVRHLRDDNRSVRLTEHRNWDWLDAPLVKPKSKDQLRKELVVAEGHDVLNELLNLTQSAKLFDLSEMPKDRLAWRPAKSTPRYHAAKQREEYEAWSSWREATIKKGQAFVSRDANRAMEKAKRGEAAVRIDLHWPQFERKGVHGGQVEILDPVEFDSFRGKLGFL